MADKRMDQDKLDKVIEAMQSSDKLREQARQSDNPTLQAAARLMDSKPPALSSSARDRIRQKIRESQPQPAESTAAEATKSQRVIRLPYWQGLAKLAAAVMIVFGMGMMTSYGAAQSLPGDVLYPVKQQLEQLELTLAQSPQDRAQVYLTQANRRLNEANQLLDRQQVEPDVIQQAVTSLETATELVTADVSQARSNDLQAQTATSYQRLVDTLQRADSIGGDDAALASIDRAAVNLASRNPLLSPPETPTPVPVTATALPPPETAIPTEESSSAVETTNTPEAEATALPDVAPRENAPPEPPQILFVDADDRVNMRGGPDEVHDVIMVLDVGTSLERISQDGDWTQVRLPDGTTGWIASFLLSESMPSTVNPPAPASDDSDSETAENGSRGDFGCDQPGNACNAPGRNKDQSGNAGNRGNRSP